MQFYKDVEHIYTYTQIHEPLLFRVMIDYVPLTTLSCTQTLHGYASYTVYTHLN
jgi:hypothetical protein